MPLKVAEAIVFSLCFFTVDQTMIQLSIAISITADHVTEETLSDPYMLVLEHETRWDGRQHPHTSIRQRIASADINNTLSHEWY